MTKQDKRIQKLKGDGAMTFDEVTALLEGFGFVLETKGKTSGSRYGFYRERDGAKILLHRPHSGDVLKPYVKRQLLQALMARGDIR